MTGALWYLDPHHEKVASRPHHLGGFHGYNDFNPLADVAALKRHGEYNFVVNSYRELAPH